MLHGDWERLRDMRVGERVGAVTEEANNVARYFMAVIRGGYNLIALAVFLVVALAVSARVSIVVALAGVFLGSVAQRLLHLASCPVLVIPDAAAGGTAVRRLPGGAVRL